MNKYYTSRGYGYEFYSELIFVESKALKQAHSKLCNCFINAAIDTISAARKPQQWSFEYKLRLVRRCAPPKLSI